MSLKKQALYVPSWHQDFMKKQPFIAFLSVLFLSACEDKRKSEFIIADVPMIVGMFGDYYGNHVLVVGHMHKPSRGDVLELIPSREHENLKPPANVLRLLLFPDEKIRSSSVGSEMQGCIGKMTYFSGRVDVFSGLPTIKQIREVSY
ncbi:hypothetical protein [Microbulbifer guangxiensis]|uniref:hypothetical protein n=1 Tax=Microbulbifer guangxiensis TaxID=2904249 RepID=UPI001F33DCC5|nr:hypothetical protein [Microbulbifer guangxiensis]